MATFTALVIGASIAVFLVWYLTRFAKNRKFIYSFTNPGTVYPLIGHAHEFFNVDPEYVVDVFIKWCRADPEKRIATAAIGESPLALAFHPETVEPLLSSNVHITKSILYKPLLPWLGTGLLTSTGPKWRARRKMLTPAFHFKILDDSMKVFNENATRLAHIVVEDGSKGQNTIDLFPYMCRCTLDIILESAMGKNLDLQHNRHSEYALCIQDMVHLLQTRQKTPWLLPDALFNLSSWKGKQDKYLAVLHGFTNSVIAEKRKEVKTVSDDELGASMVKKRVAFLDLLLNVKTAEGHGLTDSEIREEVDTFMFEGHDTTACALSWTLLLLANNPDCQEKILEEQREIFADVDDFSGADVKQDQLTKMKYLEACIKEGLRLYPSVPIFGRALEEDLYIDGKIIPSGTSFLCFTYLLHRNAKVWDEPDKFNPERFLSGASDEVDRHAYAYVPFSAGPRNCIGQRFALMEEKTVLSKLLRKVKVEEVSKVEDVKPVIEIITRPKGPINVKFVPRS